MSKREEQIYLDKKIESKERYSAVQKINCGTKNQE
jgi:hypothetical protein